MIASCPECQADVVRRDDVRINEVLVCGDCASELEVVAVAPVMLALAPEVEEDWGE
jgi:alpha-aminoadipate/glutamate carrier protein LysW